ncbi:MAG: hypothetical protein C4315_06290 [Chloroflexota bacterium]
MAGPDERTDQHPDGQTGLGLEGVEDHHVGVAAEFFPVTAGGFGDLLSQWPAAVRVVPEDPADHPSSFDQMF